MEHDNFAWPRVEPLMGLPYDDPRVRDLFTRAGLRADEVWRELRVGIYAMAPYDSQPSPLAEIDLMPSYGVRFRFKHARLVEGGAARSPNEFVVAAVTYFLGDTDSSPSFRASLPYGISPDDTVENAIRQVGRPPTFREDTANQETAYVEWEDRNPTLHILFRVADGRLLRVNDFLRPLKDTSL